MEEEEQKDQDKFVRPSIERVDSIPPQLASTQKQPDVRLGDPGQFRTDNSVEFRRKPSEFNLHKDLNSSLHKKGLDESLSLPQINKDKLVTEESIVKITSEQHRMIIKFVDEMSINIQNNLVKLYENLIQNQREDEKFPLLIEELRCNSKDIDNCFDDLKAYPFPNSEEYLFNLESTSLLIKKIHFEYSTHKRNLKTYKEIKEVILEMLKQHNPNISETRTTDYTSGMTHRIENNRNITEEKGSMIFIPKEESVESTFRAKEKDELFDFHFATRPDRESHTVLPRISNLSSPRMSLNEQLFKDSMAPTDKKSSECQIMAYERIKQALESQVDIWDTTKKAYTDFQNQVQVFKRVRNSSMQTREMLPTIQIMEALEKEADKLKNSFESLKRELSELDDQARKAFELYQYEENSLRIKQLSLQIEHVQEEVEDLEKQFLKLTEEINIHEENNLSASQRTLSQNLNSLDPSRKQSPKLGSMNVPTGQLKPVQGDNRVATLHTLQELSQVKLDFKNSFVGTASPDLMNSGLTMNMQELEPYQIQNLTRGIHEEKSVTASKGYNTRYLGEDAGSQHNSPPKEDDIMQLYKSTPIKMNESGYGNGYMSQREFSKSNIKGAYLQESGRVY